MQKFCTTLLFVNTEHPFVNFISPSFNSTSPYAFSLLLRISCICLIPDLGPERAKTWRTL